MASEVKLPRLGQGVESGTIVKWLKSEGDAVEKGEPLYELDTDKVTQEVEAEASGVLLKIAVADGAGARLKASPLARRMARERGVELGALRGTGPEGRIVAEDVERAASGGVAAPAIGRGQAPAVPVAAPSGEVERRPLTSVRRTI